MAGNSNDKNGEQQRRDNYADQAEKNRAEKLQLGRHRRCVVAQFRTGQQANQNPRRQRPPRGGIGCDQCNRQPRSTVAASGRARKTWVPASLAWFGEVPAPMSSDAAIAIVAATTA